MTIITELDKETMGIGVDCLMCLMVLIKDLGSQELDGQDTEDFWELHQLMWHIQSLIHNCYNKLYENISSNFILQPSTSIKIFSHSLW